jgi:hypothetical protein
MAAAGRFSIAKREPCARSYVGMGFDEIARLHILRPEPATRTALLTMNVSTKADALAALDLLGGNAGDTYLDERLVDALRQFLGVT